MAYARGFASLTQLNLIFSPPIYLRRLYQTHGVKPSSRISCNLKSNYSAGKFRDLKLSRSVELDQFITSEEEEEAEDEIGEGFFEAIEELERMTREPSDILEEMNHRLSSRELQLMLVYFAQEGRDSWCTLEVFEWLKKEDRVDEEMMELMVSIMCGWVKKLILDECGADQVFDLLIEMDCVGLKPGFSMMEKVIALYCEMGKKESAVLFVKEVLRRRDGFGYSVVGGSEGRKGGPVGYLAWKLMVDGEYKEAVDLVVELRVSGLKPEAYSYLIAMTAIVKELNSLGKTLRELKRFTRAGYVAEMDDHDRVLIEKYQSETLSRGLQLATWAVEEGQQDDSIVGVVHERLLAMYICAGRGPEAEKQLWKMKLAGREPEAELHDIVIAICASQKEVDAVSRLLTRVEFMGSKRKKKTLSWLLRGYVKGGHFEEAAETLIKMIDSGLHPEYIDRVAVMQGMTRKIQRPRDIEAYMGLCKRLFDAGLVGPCLVYLYIDKYKLWIVKMI
ncbi:PREDICTED: pentatricopeptide repeat-containing protein At2g30100, chloroplastic isoform X1 [Camelina sativa]|uniref:Pentatricopeptide repeat-containing protein At2g30100, chloroplastic isoform X1 n=1 Tax=Camelina sativa TaxID=90675 RepID=A0ABM1Q8F7_CAMSA|nr:PREDICTED: pentatricopeptide repeat-containing protein At2g30100, chloroplastic isoform X2 [Camelina sativa]XP_019083045.1 PREDICTED: pentatricopeptide repeat-containing protein At2g30100, chloroplastic isoform X1 [Camelina sativa]